MSDLAERRLETVRRHMALEMEYDWDAVIATFDGHPRYEMATGQVYDGEEAVRGYFAGSRAVFPDQGNEIIAIAHTDDTVLVEFWLTGTHEGAVKLGDRVIEPTGRKLRARMAASFEFAPGTDKILCERPYFDQLGMLRSIGIEV
ncbi:MAG: nuclear transport factor 2 family protein [Sphingomonadaceae bacterium]|jgi:ketosteroid isomerase-like protein|nr:nuclear transport factor 2 family protein [Rhizobiaceae bacterium]MCB2085230.1 nuclear transport factor 2 family protein [Sphingomonadaceae bacterium]MCP5384062.1 nuclear transport factor 2 family protein [Altererythrobacter sp.]MCP5391784.1 nuclear transport factor 2 family protein [Sphingomonadaceae bacterium]MCP5393056.1 nuclear transport factor 2 family protein [Sphingomonadaceae bacterium]